MQAGPDNTSEQLLADDLAERRAARLGALVSMAWAQWPAIVLAVICMGIAALATAGYAYLVGPVLRSLFAGSGVELGPVPESFSGALGELAAWLGRGDPIVLGSAIVAAATVKGLAFFGQQVLVIRAGQRVLLDLRSRMYLGLLRQNPLERQARATGDLVSRFTVDVETVEQGVSLGLSALVRDVLQIAALAGLAIALDPVLGLLGLIAFPLIAALIVRIGKELRHRRRQVHQSFGEVGQVVEETASGLDVIQSFGAGSLMRSRFGRASTGLMRRVIRAVVLRAFASPLNEVLGAAALALTLWYAHRRIAVGGLQPDAFVSFFTALLLLYRPVKGLGQANHAIQSALAALDRLQGLLARAAADEPDAIAPPVGPQRVELRGVEAGYGAGADPVLRGVNLEVCAGSTLAVVGPSGAGKTTLLNLLRGFLTPTSGELLVDGRPVPAGPAAAHSLFAPVPQQPFLFDDTIETNVRLGRAGASDREVEEACRAAGVLEFAGELPGRLETVVGPGGASLSMGQRQRVCLARALLSRAPILLLDEVTASLDGETERALFEGLVEQLRDRTVLVVTHRLSTAQSADRIALLEGGVIRAAGPSGDLLAGDRRLIRLFGGQARSVQSSEEEDVA